MPFEVLKKAVPFGTVPVSQFDATLKPDWPSTMVGFITQVASCAAAGVAVRPRRPAIASAIAAVSSAAPAFASVVLVRNALTMDKRHCGSPTPRNVAEMACTGAPCFEISARAAERRHESNATRDAVLAWVRQKRSIYQTVESGG